MKSRNSCFGNGERVLSHHLGLSESPWRSDDGQDFPYAAGKQRAIEHSGGNISQAAQRCGLTRAAFHRIMRQLGIGRDPFLQG